jgi:hypothetical protein
MLYLIRNLNNINQMKIKPFYILSLVAITLAFTFQACEEEDKTFQGDPIFAFDGTQYRNIVITDVEPTIDFPVMLVGPHQSQSVSTNFEILPFWVNESGDTLVTTLEEGVHFNEIPKTVEIAANSSYSNITLDFNFDSLAKGQSYFLLMELTGGDFGVSPIGNNRLEFEFLPHLYFKPEEFVGTFPAQELSNQPGLVRDYNITMELDSSIVNGDTRKHYFSVSGLWNIVAGDSTAGAWDRQKISIVVDDSDPVTSVVTVDQEQEFQEFFKLANGDQVYWEFNTPRDFDTWTNFFRFPSFNLKTLDGTTPVNFPPQAAAAPRGQNVRVDLVLDGAE